MRKLVFGVLGLLWFLPACGGLTPAQAQQVNLYCYQGPTNPQWAPCASGNPLYVSASVSASITGFPGTTQTTGTPISVTTGGVTGTLPAGAEVVASNAGATNVAYCKLGASATTSDQPIPPNSWFGFTVGTNTQLTCITSTSTTTVNMVGGSGLPTGSGGGGGGSGSSGAVFGPTAAGSAAANPPVLLGGTQNGGATGTVQNAEIDSSANLHIDAPNGSNLATLIASQIPACTSSPCNLIGYVSNDPCAYGNKTNVAFTTNGTSSVQLVALSGSTTIYVCALHYVVAGATTVAFTTGTGTACATNNAAVIGSTTTNVANSMSYAANGGETYGNGSGTIAKGAASAEFCMVNGTNVYVSGNLTYVQL